MYLGSDEFNSAIENTNGNAPKIRVTLEDGTTLANIKSIKYYGGSNDSDDISIGSINMARIDVNVLTDKMLTNNEIFLEQGIELANGVVEYMPIGYFTVQKPSGDFDEVMFTAYDRMQKFEKPYNSSLAYPTTSILILNELCQICGIELATTLDNAIEVTENLKGYTCREVLGYIASMHGCFACIDRYGRLNVRWYSDAPIEKNLKKIWHFEKSQDNFEIAKVEIAKDSETNYVSGDGITTLHNSNPLATQEITDDIFAKLGGFAYSVGEIEMLDDARLDPWDMVSVEYYDGKTYIIPCMSLEHDFKAYSTTVKSVGKSESENEYRFTGPTIQYLNRMAADLLVANRVIATKVDAEYVNSVAITTENFDAKVAEIKELIVEEIDGKYANIDLANIDIANINVGKIGELFAKVGLLDRATIVDGHVTGFLDAVEINANKITAGTLIADRILLSGGENGVLYALNNLGELTSTNVDTLDGYVLTDRTINADKLIANSITANELDVNEIFGNTAVLNKIVSQQIFSDAISANSIVVGASNKAEEALDASQSTNKASGSPILLTDSADGTLIDFKGKGRSTQKQYSGKNLLQNTATTQTIDGVTFTVNDDKSVTVNGKATDNASLYLTQSMPVENGKTYIVNGAPSSSSSTTYCMVIQKRLGTTFITSAQVLKEGLSVKGDGTFDTLYVGIAVLSGQSVSNVTFYPMVSIEGGEYEPYVGGVASPNPDYPQAIKSVADGGYFDGELLQGYYNSATGEHITSNTNAICSKNSIPCKEGDNIKVIYPTTLSQIRITYYKNGTYVSFNTKDNVSEASFTVPTNVTEFKVTIIDTSTVSPTTAKHITVTINNKYALTVKSCGKNLWEFGDKSFTAASEWLYKTLKVGTYTISVVVTGSGTDGTKSAIYFYSDNRAVKGIPLQRNARNSYTFTLDEDITKMMLFAETDYSNSNGDTATWSDIQLEFGDKATSYEPYKETVSYIPLNEPLRSIGDVSDEVSPTEVNRRFTEVVFDGSSDEQWLFFARGNGTDKYVITVPNAFNFTSGNLIQIRVICDKLVGCSPNDINNDTEGYKICLYSSGRIVFSLPEGLIATNQASARAWLQANPITVQYELAEPVVETIEPVDIATYNNVTYITATDNAEMEVEYYRNTATGQQLANMHKVNKASGITVKSITIHYLATNVGSGITTSTSGWTTTVQNITADNKYLWTYQTFTYTDDTTSNTTPVISGVYGNEGKDGVDGKDGADGKDGTNGTNGTNGISVSKVTPLYYLKSNTTAPSAPTSAVTSTATTSGVWTTAVPTYASGYTYFTCTQTLYSNNTYGWSTVVIDNGLTSANSTATSANNTATTANNTANGIKNNIYKSGTTLIDGAKIYTGSITADKIDVDDLFAEDITATGTIRGAILKSINYDEDTGVGMLLNLNNATIESRGEDFVNIFDSRGHYGRYTLAPEGMIFAEERDYLTGQPNLSITNGQLTLNNVKYNSYGIRYSDVDILNWTTEGIATPKLSTDLIYCNGEMAAKTVTASVIRNSTYDLGNVGNIAVQNKQDIATINSNLFKTDDFNIILSELTWNGSSSNMKWASYNITSKIHATKILSVSILNYSSWRNTDCINVTIGQTPDKIQIISNTTSFLATTSNIVVRVHYV